MPQANPVITQAELAFDRQEWQEAAALYSQFAGTPKAGVLHGLRYCYALEHAGQVDEALDRYLELSYKHPVNEDVHTEVASFYQRQLKPQDAAIFLGRALCVNADAQVARQALEALGLTTQDEVDHACVMGALAGESVATPVTGLLLAVVLWPWVNSAMSSMRKKAWRRAEASFRTILKRAPRYVPMLVQLGHSLREQERFTQALSTYRRAILFSPRDPDTYLHLGHTLKSMGRHLSALDAYSTALMLRPTFRHAQIEIETLERFLQSRGLSTSINTRLLEGQPAPGDVSPLAIPSSDRLTNRQKIIFSQIASAISSRN